MTDVKIHMNVYNIDSGTARKQLQSYHDMMMGEHLHGLHPYGSMRKDCPLCVQINKLGD